MIYQNKYQNTARLRIYIILIVMGIPLLTGGGYSAMLEKIRQTRKPLIFSVMAIIGYMIIPGWHRISSEFKWIREGLPIRCRLQLPKKDRFDSSLNDTRLGTETKF